MRHPFMVATITALALSACAKSGEEQVESALADLNVVDESNLSDVMLTVSDPNEGVAYFTRAIAEKPDRVDLKRGLAKSLIRAKRVREAVDAWSKVIAHPESTLDDQVEYADALIRNDDWKTAATVLNAIPPTHESFKRYRLEAMVADSNKDWKRADSFYETAVGLTTNPASVLNNWGFSKLTRGDFTGAEKLLAEAVQADSTLFTAKNNLVLARAAQRKYDLPVVNMSQIERAQLLHTAALAAIKQGDVNTGKGLLKEAIDTHPQHFEAAVRSLRALEANVSN